MTNINFLSLLGLTIFLLSLPTCVFVYFHNPRRENNISLSLFNLGTSFWSLGLFFSFISKEHNQALFWARFLNTSAILIPVFFLHFVYSFLEISKKKRGILIGYYFVYIFFIITVLINPNEFVKDMKPKFDLTFYPSPGILYYLFPVLFAIPIFETVIRLIQKLIYSTGQKKTQLKYLIFATVLGFSGGGTTFFMVFDIPIYPYGLLGVPALNVLIAYSIIKHRLLDVEILLSKIISRFLTFLVYYGVYTLIYFLYRKLIEGSIEDPNQIGLFILTGLYLLFPFQTFSKLNKEIQSIPDSVLLKDFFSIPKTSKYFSEKMGKAIDLIEFFRTVEDIFLNIVHCSKVRVYLREDFQTGKSESIKKYFIVNPGDGRINSNISISSTNLLIQEGKNNAKAIVYDEVDSDLQIELDQLHSKIFIPCLVEKGEILGIVVLSEKLLGKSFTNNDLTFFDLMTTEFGIILDRILAYSKNLMLSLNLEKTQKSLMVAQFINEYIHEIKTPLTALEGFATVDDLSNKEFKSIVLEQTNRIKNLLINILKIANNQRIRDIRPVNINRIIESVLGLFTDMGKKNRNFDPNLPYIFGDYEDLQIVFTNLIKNAREAMFSVDRARRQISIQTKYLSNTNEIEISVTDTGPGIPEEKLQMIWKRFQSSKLNDGGSGLGLSIVKRIVTEHQGTIHVTSQFGISTTFQILFDLTENKKEYEKGLSETDWRMV